MNRSTTGRPVAALVVAAALWGGAMTATKYAVGVFGPVTLLTAAVGAATVVLWIAVAARRRCCGTVPSWRLAAVLGLLEPALAYLGQTAGLARTSASNAAVIVGLESCFVVLLAAVFLREHTGRSAWVAVGAGIAGLFVLEGTGWLSGPGSGDLLVTAGTACAAGYVIVARRMDEATDPMLLTARQFTVASLALVPLVTWAWASGAESPPTEIAPRYWIAAALVGVAGYALSFLLYNHAIVTIEAVPAAIVINLIPAFGLLTAVLFLGERLAAHQLLGVALLSASVALCVATRRAAEPALAVAADESIRRWDSITVPDDLPVARPRLVTSQPYREER